MIDLRTIESICTDLKDEKGFSIELLGNVYCKLARNRPVECIYCKQTTDHNDLYCCMNLYYANKHIDIITKYQKN